MSTDSEIFGSDEVIEYKARGAKDFETGQYRDFGWKGLGGDIEDIVGIEKCEKPAVTGKTKAASEKELDMTPMVDVTFLLLIFFMVSASFVLQKSLELPQDLSEKPSTGGPDPLEVVEVLIDQNNVFYVSSHDAEFECPSEREMRSRLLEIQQESNADRMIIRAHVDSMHHRVVSAWDAGRVAGLQNILFRTTEEEL